MKKCLSLLLILMILVSSYGGALADTLKLPSSLISIEEEAFFGASSLDVVDIPWGTETIGSKAFANSSVTKVYIPDTVYKIADDAFDNVITIASSESSYAKYFSQEHELLWENAGNHYWQNAIDEISQEAGEEGSARMELWEYVSTDGVADPEELEEIEEYNTFVAEMNELIKSYNQDLDTLYSASVTLAEELSDISYSQTENVAIVSLSGMTVIADVDLNYESFTDIENAGDGTFLVKNGDSVSYYMNILGDTVVLSKTQNTLRSRSTSEGGYNIGNFFSDTFGASLMAFTECAREALEDARINALKTEKKMDKWKEKMDRVSSRRNRENYANNSAKFKISKINLAKTTAAFSALSAMNIFLQYQHLKDIYQDLDRIREIVSHGHPNSNDITTEAILLSNKLNGDIDKLLWAYRADIALTTVGIVTSALATASAVSALVSATTGVGAPVAAMLAGVSSVSYGLTAAAFATGLAIQWQERQLLSAILEAEAKLHTWVYGTVIDVDTNKPITYVEVKNGNASVYTDAEGKYEFYLLPGAHTLLFTHKGYIKDGFIITLSARGHYEKNMMLVPENGIIYGYAYNFKTKEKLSEVEVYVGENAEPSALTDENGYYFLTLPTKEVQLTFKKEGYTDYPTTVTPVYGESIPADAPMSQKFGTVSGVVTDEFGDALRANIDSDSYHTYCDGNGWYSFSLPVGTRKIIFSMDGYESVTETITVQEGENPPLNAELPWSYGLCGTVTDESGTPVPEANIYVFDYQENVSAGWYNPVYYKYLLKTDANGNFRIKLTPGKYFTLTSANGFINDNMNEQYTRKEVTVKENGITDMSVQLTDTRGKYCVWVTVTPYFPQRSVVFSGTISDGNRSYEFDRYNAQGNKVFYCVSSSRYVDFSINGTVIFKDTNEICRTINEIKTIDLEGKDRISLP